MNKMLNLIKSLRNNYVEVLFLIKLFRFIKLIYLSDTIIVTGTGVLQVFFKNNLIKIPLGSLSFEALNTEYNNYLSLKKSNLRGYVNYSLEKINSYYKMEILQPVNDIDIVPILKSLEDEQVIEKCLPNLSLKLLNRWSKSDFKYSFTFEYSVMHGDLTPKNIMKNIHNEIVLIDLDRFTFKGIKGIDQLHFLIEKETKEKNISFFDWILDNYNLISDKNLLFIYFIYRINAEHFDNVKLSPTYYMKSCEIYKIFINLLGVTRC